MLIGIAGLVGAGYLFLHHTASTVPGLGNDSHLDSTLFGTAIALVSILLLVNARPHAEPDAGDSQWM